MLNSTVNIHLLIDEANDFVDCLFAGHSEVLWRPIIRPNDAFKSLGEQRLASGRVLHEIEEHDFVEVGTYLCLIIKVEVVVKLGEFEDDLDCLRLVGSRKASMLLSLEDAVAALENEVWADRVSHAILTLVPLLLLGDEHNRAEVF